MRRHPSRPRFLPLPTGAALLPALLLLVLLLPPFSGASASSPPPLRVVMDDNYPPYVFRGADNALDGILPDQWRLWSRATGREVRLYGMEWGKALARMEAGEFDVIDTIFRTPERERRFDFSPPYARIDVSVYFPEGMEGIGGMGDLRGFAVAVKRGDASADTLREAGVGTLVEYPSYEAIVDAARYGAVKVFVMDRPPARYFLHRMGVASRFHETEPVFAGEFHRAVRKGSAGILAEVAGGFARIPPGDLERVRRRWAGSPVADGPSSRQLLAAGGAVALLVAVGAAWLFALRRAVAARTAELRREAEARAAEERRAVGALERFQAFFDNVNDAIFIHDGETGAVLDVNRRTTEMFGWDREDVLRLGVGELSSGVSPCTADDAREWLRKAREEGPQLFPWQGRHRSGRVFPVEVSARYVRVGEEGRFYVTVRDVAERLQAEERARESEGRYRRLVESSPLGIHAWKLEEDGRLVFTGANPAADRILGVDHRRYLGMTIVEAFPSLAGTEVPERYREICRGGGNWSTEQIDYQDRVIRGAYEVYAFQTGPGAMAAMFADVTERARARAERDRLAEQLRQAQKMEAVGRLAGGVAHDFNNLLTAIFGYAELLSRRLPPGEAAARDLAEIRGAAEMAASLTRQLLAFSRKQILEPRVIEVADAVTDVQRMIGRLLGEDIELEVRVGAGTGCILADPSQLQQVIMNLAVNARDAMPRGGRLAIETAPVDVREGEAAAESPPPGPYVSLSVTDTGCGMDAETRSRLFEPFFTTKGPGRGTGLGLATVHGIVTQSGGYISVSSEVGKGTAFRILFPRVEAGEEEEGKAEPPLPRGSETVLVVEDSPEVRALACRMLSLLGYRVLEAGGGEEALALSAATAGEIHMVFTDVVMPGRNGREVAEALAAARPGIRVGYTSGYTEDAVVEQGTLLPGVRLLRKPYHLADLAAFVRSVLDEAAGGE